MAALEKHNHFPGLLESKKTWDRAMIYTDVKPPVTIDKTTKVTREGDCLVVTFNNQPVQESGTGEKMTTDIRSHILLSTIVAVDYFTINTIIKPDLKIIQ